jgi:mannosyl-oligosaccharide alpha-1,2-mannosidase
VDEHLVPAARSTRRTLLLGLAAAGGLTAVGGTGIAEAAARPAGTAPADTAKATAVRNEFLRGWNGYKRFAFGRDEVHPVSGTASEFFAGGHPVGLSIVEALDTLYVMELDTELATATSWVQSNLSFDIDANFHVFEAIIRLVGGLLAGYLCTKQSFLLTKARDIADRLLPAFTKSPTGIPFTQVNLRTGAVSGNTPPLAEVGTNILEFGVLSNLTGDRKYFNAAKKAYQATISRRSSLNLLGTTIDTNGNWRDSTDTAPNPPVDSFYEYLWGGFVLFGDQDLRNWYNMLVGAINSRMIDRVNGQLWYKQVDFRTGQTRGRRQSELAAFWAGLLGKAGDLNDGTAYFNSWTAVANKYKLIPDNVSYPTLSGSGGNALRPEYANSAFDLYRLTLDQTYRNAAWQYFLAMRANQRVSRGYTVVNDVTTSPMPKGDHTPAYWFAENMKYLYLTFAAAPRFDYVNGYLSTEGRILRGAR